MESLAAKDLLAVRQRTHDDDDAHLTYIDAHNILYSR